MFATKPRQIPFRQTLMTSAAAAALFGFSAAAQAGVPITGTQLQSQVGTTVNPDFQGGTLRDDQNNVTDNNSYAVENFPGNTIDAFGNVTTFAGPFSGAGSLTITDSVGGGNVIFTGASILGGSVTVDNGATMTWGNGTTGAFLVGQNNAVLDNGSLVMDFGTGSTVIGDIPISGTGSVTIHSGTLSEVGPSTYTGGTTIDSGGVLQLGSGSGTNGTVVGNIVDNGLLQFNYTGAPVNADNQISGTGSAEFQQGTTIITGASAIGGTVTIDSGATMQWGNGNPGFLVGGGNAVTDNGALVMNFGGGGVAGDLPISGSGTVELQSGALNLNGVSTYTGATTVDAAGDLLLSGAGSIGGSSDVIDNGTFDISGTTAGASITTLDGAGTVALGAQTLTLTNASGTFGGVIQDAGFTPGTGGGLTIAGGTETLTGTNTFTGATTIDPGATLALGNGGTTGTVAGNIVDNGLVQFDYGGSVIAPNTFTGTGAAEMVAGTTVITGASAIGGTVTIDSGATMQWGNGNAAFLIGGSGVVDNGALVMDFGGGGVFTTAAISGSGNVTLQSGSFNAGGANTYTGTTTIESGSLFLLSGAGSIGGSSDVIDNGTFDISGTTAGTSITTLDGAGTVALGAQTLTLTNASGTFGGVIQDAGFSAGTGGGLTIAGGTETLTGTNTFTGPTTINPGATLALGNGGTTGTVAGNIVDNGLVQFDYGGSVIAPNTFTGTGAAEMVAGTTVITGASAIGGTVTIDSGATMQWGNGNAAFLIGGAGVVDNGSLVMDFGGGGVGTNAAISGSGNVTLQSGSFNAGGANTYTGTTTIESGSLFLLSGAGSIGGSSDVIDNGTFDISGTTAGTSITTLDGAGTVALGAQTLTLTNASGTFGGVIQDAGFTPGTGGGLTIAGGTETLTGTNTFTGATTIDPGATLALGNGGTTGTVAGNIVDNGLVQFDYGGSVIAPNTFTGTGAAEMVAGTTVITGASAIGGTVTIDSGATMQWGNGNAAFLIGGAGVVDNGSLVMDFGGGGVGTNAAISGSGTVTLQSGSYNTAAANTYSGTTTIDAGALFLVSSTGSIANSDVIDNGTFDITGTTGGTSIRSLDGTGGVSIGGQTLTLNNAAGTFSGVIEDAGFSAGTGGGLTIGGGTETLTGTNIFTGATTINPGATLALGNGGTTGTVAGNIVDNGLVQFNYDTSVVTPNNFTGAGSAEVVAGTVVATGASAIGGAVTIDNGATMQWGNGNAAFLIGGSGVVDNGALVMDFGGGGVFTTAAISGSGNVTLQSGSFNAGGANTYTGTTTIESGSLFLLSGAGSIGGSSDVIDNGTFDISGTTAGASITTLDGAGTVALGAQTLTLTNASGTFGGVIQDAGFTPGTGGGLTIAGGTETLTGTNTFTGATTINPGATLALGNGGTTGTVAGNLVDNGNLNIDHSNALIFGQTISGSGALNQIGSGTTILNASNPFDGLTTISAGVLQVGDAAHSNASLAGSVIVGPSGTLTGHGSIEGSVANAGSVSPGGTIGTLTVGSYNQAPAGTLAIEVSPTAASQLNSLGAASLNGNLALTFDAGTYSPHVYPIVLGNPVTGTFSNVTEAGSVGPGAVAGLVYAPTQVDLVTETTGSAQIFGGVSVATMDRAENFASMVVDRFGPAGCADARTDRQAVGCSGSNAWVYAFGSWDHHGSDGAAFGFQNGGEGVIGGIGHSWDDGSMIGAAFGYAHNSLHMNDADAKASGPSYYGAIYGRLVAGTAWLDGEAFYMGTNWSANRMVSGIGVARSSPKTKTEGFLLQASLPIGYSGLRPYVRFTYIHSTRDAISENGAGLLDFAIQSDSEHSAIGEAGLLYAPSVATTGGTLVQPSLQLGVQDNFGDRSEIVSGSLVGIQGTQFEQLGPRTSRIAAVAEGSLKIGVSRSFDLYGDVRARFGSHQTDGFAGIGGVLRF